jgi:hypothetical protein
VECRLAGVLIPRSILIRHIFAISASGGIKTPPLNRTPVNW